MHKMVNLRDLAGNAEEEDEEEPCFSPLELNNMHMMTGATRSTTISVLETTTGLRL